MSISRKNFYERLETTRNAIDDFRLVDLPLIPVNASHNSSVRIIRNGLAVQCFNILEDFAKARTAEVLNEISTSAVQFRYLPTVLQNAMTIDTVKAINFQIRLLDSSTRLAYVQQYSKMISSTDIGPMILPDIGFFHASSNISKDNFRDALSAFAIDKPWIQVSGICSRLGLSGVPAETVYDSLAQRRHNAAHNASATVSEGDLLQSIKDAFGLAISYDILISAASRSLIGLKAVQPSNFKTITDHTRIPLRFIKWDGRKFSEVKEGSFRNYRTAVTSTALVSGAHQRTRNENGALIVYNTIGSVEKWLL